jgi:hypothetical protein
MTISDHPSEPSSFPIPYRSVREVKGEDESLRNLVHGRDIRDFRDKIELFVLRVRATGALFADHNARTSLQNTLDAWQVRLLQVDRRDLDYTLAPHDPTLEPPPGPPPYLGLRSFEHADHKLFFGREQLVTTLIEHLRTSRLVVITGPSGSGKSSLMLGGLLPKLKNGALPGSETWHYYDPIVPGSDPLGTLARLIQSTHVVDRDGRRFLRGKGELVAQIHAQQQGQQRGPVVLVVDQLEELFTLCADNAVRWAFITNLLALTLAKGPPHLVIITMRSDFERHLAQWPKNQRYFEQNQVLVLPPGPAELRAAITEPAEWANVHFEEGLVKKLVEDLQDEPARLPLLQFTLLRLWDRREYNRITWDAYLKLGSGREALARRADEVYAGLEPKQQEIVRWLMLKLVKAGEELRVTSNRVRRMQLYQDNAQPDQVKSVLNKLIEAGLVREITNGTAKDAQGQPLYRADDTLIELAHEALIHTWPQLVRWCGEDERLRSQRQQLAKAAKQWDEQGRHPSMLLQGLLLEEALSYKDRSPIEQAFVDASTDALKKLLDNGEAVDVMQVRWVRVIYKTEQLRAEVEARLARRLRRLAFALAAVSLVAVISAVVAGLQWQVAADNLEDARQSRTQEALAQSTAALAQSTSQAAQGAVSSIQMAQQALAATATAASSANEETRSAVVMALTSAAETARTAQAFSNVAALQAQTAVQDAQAAGAFVLEVRGQADIEVQNARESARAALAAQDAALTRASQAEETALAAQNTANIAATDAAGARAVAGDAQTAAAVAAVDVISMQQTVQAAQATAAIAVGEVANAQETALVAQTSAADAVGTAQAAEAAAAVAVGEVANAQMTITALSQQPPVPTAVSPVGQTAPNGPAQANTSAPTPTATTGPNPTATGVPTPQPGPTATP